MFRRAKMRFNIRDQIANKGQIANEINCRSNTARCFNGSVTVVLIRSDNYRCLLRLIAFKRCKHNYRVYTRRINIISFCKIMKYARVCFYLYKLLLGYEK